MLGPGWYAWRSCSAGRTKRAHSVTALAYGSLSYDLVITGGLVVTAEQAVVADVAVAGERIAAIGSNLTGSVKLYMAYEGYRLPDVAIFRAMAVVGSHGGLAVLHAENDDVIGELGARLDAEGRTGPAWLAASCPPEAEAEAVHRAIVLAGLTG